METNTGQVLEQLYALNQDLHFFSREYRQKFSYSKIEELVKKVESTTNKNLDYILKNLEQIKKKHDNSSGVPIISIFDIMSVGKKEDIDTISKLVFLLQYSTHTGSSKHDISYKLGTIKQDFTNILGLQEDINKISKELPNVIRYVQSEIWKSFKNNLEDNPLGQKLKKQAQENKQNKPQTQEELLNELFSQNYENNKEKETNTLQEQIDDITDKLAFFQIIRSFYKKYNYVITYQESIMIQDILEDLRHGKIVTLLGETGSGKTELAKFICKAFLHKEPIEIAGSKFLADTDFTLEKIVTSKSIVSADTLQKQNLGGLSKEEYLEKIARDTFSNIVLSKKFKDKLKKFYQEQELSDEEIEKNIKELDTLGYNLFTEHHLMGLFKGMYLGRPVIIDEANLIRPEVFMALNDILLKKIGDSIELPNGLGTFDVKDGFSIILTGNDPDATDKQRYTLGRYSFDEAFYNRLSTYNKNYYTQKEINYSDNTEYDTIDFLSNQQLYSILLMMLFDHKKNPYGIKIQKEYFDSSTTDKEKKTLLLQELKHLAQATSLIQKAFLGEPITILKLNADISAHNEINRKVLTMRNINDIISAWIEGDQNMDYYIYKNFIRGEGRPDEKYAVIALFHEKGFFDNLVSDDKNQTLENLEQWYQKQREPGLSKMGKEKKQRTIQKLTHEVLINKFDIIQEFFGKKNFLHPSKEILDKQVMLHIEDNNTSQVDETSLKEKEEQTKNLLGYFSKNYNKIQKVFVKNYKDILNDINKKEEYKDIIDQLHNKEAYLQRLLEQKPVNTEEIKNTEEELGALKNTFGEFIGEIQEASKQYPVKKEEFSKIIGFLEEYYAEKSTIMDNTSNLLDEGDIDTINECLEKIILSSSSIAT